MSKLNWLIKERNYTLIILESVVSITNVRGRFINSLQWYSQWYFANFEQISLISKSTLFPKVYIFF